MNKILTTTIFVAIFLVFGNFQKNAGASSDKQSHLKPVTEECLRIISNRYEIPIPVIMGILVSQESRVGERFERLDKTVDYGPALINSRWLKKIKRFGIRGKDLKNDGCTNILTLSWILNQYKAEMGGDIWKAVGRYHSEEPLKASIYKELVKKVAINFEKGDSAEYTKNILSWINSK